MRNVVHGMRHIITNFVQVMRRIWLVMIEPPWKQTSRYSRATRWVAWFTAWFYALIGLLAGALVAPSLLKSVGLAHTPYEDWLLIAITVLASFLVQVIGWGLLSVGIVLNPHPRPDVPRWKHWLLQYRSSTFNLAFLYLGFLMVNHLLTEVKSEQGAATIAFVGGLLVKTLVIPAIVGAVKSKAFKLFIRWLRGKEAAAG